MCEKLNKIEVEQLVYLANEVIKKQPQLRLGQTIFNLLFENHPKLANEIRGTKIDCFYVDSIIPETLEYITKKL